MKKPIEPRAPKVPEMPLKRIMRSNRVYGFDDGTLKDLMKHIPDGIDFDNIHIEQEVDCDYSCLNIFYNEEVDNPHYEYYLAYYEKQLKRYEAKLSEYEPKLKEYEVQKALYDEWLAKDKAAKTIAAEKKSWKLLRNVPHN